MPETESTNVLIRLAEANGPMALAIVFLGIAAYFLVRFVLKPLSAVFSSVVQELTTLETNRTATASITENTTKIQLQIADVQRDTARIYTATTKLERMQEAGLLKS